MSGRFLEVLDRLVVGANLPPKEITWKCLISQSRCFKYQSGVGLTLWVPLSLTLSHRMTHTWAWIISQTVGHMVENFISMELFVMYLRRGGVTSISHFFSVAIFFLCTCVSHSVKVLMIKFFNGLLCYRIGDLVMFCLIWQFMNFL